MNIAALTQVAKDLNMPGASGMRKQDLIFAILKAQAEKSGLIFGEGVLEILPDGFGFLRAPDYNYLPGPDDIYVSPPQIRRFNLHTGDTVSGQIRPPKGGRALLRPAEGRAVNYEPPERARDKILFDEPDAALSGSGAQAGDHPGQSLDARDGSDHADRQGAARPDRRAAPHRQDDAAAEYRNSITENHPEVVLIVLLIDERPEEVTDMQRSVKGEVESSRPSTSRRSGTSRWPRW